MTESTPPNAAQPPAPAPPARRARSKAVRDGLIIAGVIVVALIAIRVYNAADRSGDDDISIGSCTTQSQLDQSYGVATVDITNHGESARSYVVTVAFESSDGAQQYGTSPVAVNDLAPGQSTSQTTPATVVVPGGVECEVTHVSTF